MGRYFVETVDDELMPEGADWYFVDQPNGDAHFVVGRNDRPVEIPPEVLCDLLARVTACYKRDDSLVA